VIEPLPPVVLAELVACTLGQRRRPELLVPVRRGMADEATGRSVASRHRARRANRQKRGAA
jgi:hypothetical protein